jgi:hypothetical protein
MIRRKKFMKVKKAIELLKNENPTAKVYWDGLYEQNGLIQIDYRESERTVVLSNLPYVNEKTNEYKPIISVESLLTCLQKLPSDADVIVATGDPVLFVISYNKLSNIRTGVMESYDSVTTLYVTS